MLLCGAKSLPVLVGALSEALQGTHTLNNDEIFQLGRLACEATRLSAWSRANYMSRKKMQHMAYERAKRYTTPGLLPAWIIDMIWVTHFWDFDKAGARY